MPQYNPRVKPQYKPQCKPQGNHTLQDVSDKIAVVKDFPRPGIFFRDISPLIADGPLFKYVIDQMCDILEENEFDVILGIESRGFIFGAALAFALGKAFSMARKPGKTPGEIFEVDYGLEYGKDRLTIQKNIIPPGSKVLIVDDLIASGGSLEAACRLVEMAGSVVAGCLCLIELTEIDRVPNFSKYKLISLLKYSARNSDKTVPKTDLMLLAKPVRYYDFCPSKDDNRIVVFYHPSMEKIAYDVIGSSSKFRDGAIEWQRFQDGYPNVRFENQESLVNADVVFFGSLSNLDGADLLEQLSMMVALPRQGIKSLHIYLMYFAPATMERVGMYNVVATAETMAKIIGSCLPPTKSGNPIITIYDIHALPVRFYFPDTVTVRMQSAIPYLREIIDSNMTIVFPDEGSKKRFGEYFCDMRYVVCSKIRDGDRRCIQITEKGNWPSDDEEAKKCLENALIVDDLVQSGGTLEECRKSLENIGFKKISAYVTHAVFPNNGYQKFLTANGGKFEKFYITDTVQETAKAVKGQAPFHVIELGEKIGRDILDMCGITGGGVKNRIMTIYVGSENLTKLRAVHFTMQTGRYSAAANRYGLIVKVFGVNVPSGVKEQPFNDETATGAITRVKNLKAWADYNNCNYDFLMSVENGIDLERPSGPVDFCVAAFGCVDPEYDMLFIGHLPSTIVTPVPRDLVEICKEKEQNVTVGSMIEQKYGYKPGCWHERFGNATRFEMITTTFINLFCKNKNFFT